MALSVVHTYIEHKDRRNLGIYGYPARVLFLVAIHSLANEVERVVVLSSTVKNKALGKEKIYIYSHNPEGWKICHHTNSPVVLMDGITNAEDDCGQNKID